MPEKIVICGSGPAGLSAALHATERGCDVTILEKMARPAVKLLATGGGRCNFTHFLPENELMARFGKSGFFMRDALRYAPQSWLLDYLKSQGVDAVCLADGCFFPASDRADDVVEAFLRPIRQNGGKLLCGHTAESILVENGVARGVIANGKSFLADRVILAGGGTAAPALGGSSQALTLAHSAGHTVVAPMPAMAPLLLAETWVCELSGITLEDVQLLFGSGRQKTATRGILLFTADGISGPAAIDLSRDAYRAFAGLGKLTISIDFTPEKPREEWRNFWMKARQDSPKKLVRNTLGAILPQALAKTLVDQSVGDGKCNMELSNIAIEQLISRIKETSVSLKKMCPMSRAMAMSGGVDLREIDPKTLQSKLVQNLFFAGEMIDLVGPCGGYNLQFAFSSGRLAAAEITR